MLPIRRLQLPVGKKATVRAAWLRFPDFAFEVLEQTYNHVDSETYRYEAFSGDFVKILTVNDVGLITRYPDLWEVEADNF
jgi:uncharacterized protein